MVYKDKVKERIYRNKWDEENKEDRQKYQREYSSTRYETKQKKEAQTHFIKITGLSSDCQLEYLINLTKPKRSRVIELFPQNEQVDLVAKCASIKKIKIKLRSHARRMAKWDAFKRKHLNGAKCRCGESDPLKLVFHHIDPSQKGYHDYEDSMQSFVKKRSKADTELEITKCTVMCQNCHMLLHNSDATETLRKMVDQYVFIKSQKLSRADRKLRKAQYSIYRRILLLLLKNDHGCEKCGNAEGRCCVFHHIESKSKSHKISRMIKSKLSVFIKEIGKTCILCYNCHHVFHAFYGAKTDITDLTSYLGHAPFLITIDIEHYNDRLNQIIRDRSTL